MTTAATTSVTTTAAAEAGRAGPTTGQASPAPAPFLSVVGATMEGVPPNRDLPLVGRGPELGRLTALQDAAARGLAGAVLLAGDAGVGKTRLIGELVGRVEAAGGLVLVGRCVDLGPAGPAYLPFADALGRLVREQPEAAAVVRRVAEQRPALARLALDLAAGPAGADPAAGSGTGDDPGQRLSLFDAVAAVLDTLAAEVAPVLLVLEDLHWADPSSRDLLRYLLTRLGGQRLLLLASYRADDLHRRHPLRPLLAELVRLAGVERVDLQPFGAAELREYLAQLHGTAVDDALLAGILARSQGNAFFAAELLAAGETDGLPAEGLPAGLADVLLTRVERLPAPAQVVVRAAAVHGGPVPDGLLRAVCALPEAELDGALREAVAHQLLVPEPGERYGFRHALLQEAVYTDLLPGERVGLHARYAAALEPGGPAVAADLARHALAAHDLPGALRAAVRAGDHATDRLAPAEALAHHEQALQLWSAVPEPDRPAGIDLAGLGLRAAAAAGGAGELDRAVALARQALADAGPHPEPDREAEIRSRLALHLFDADDDRAALEQARAVRQLLAGAGPRPAGVWAAAVEVRLLAGEGGPGGVAAVAGPALEQARSLGLATAEMDLLTSLAVDAGTRGDPADAVRLLAELRERAQQVADPSAAVRARYNLALALLDVGDLAPGLAELSGLLDTAGAAGLGSSMYAFEARSVLVSSCYMAGEWDRALAVAEEGRTLLPPAMAEEVAAGALPVVAAREPQVAVRRTDGRPRGVLRAMPTRPGAPDWMAAGGYLAAGARAEALTWLGRQDEAVAVVRATLDWLRGRRDPWHLSGLWLTAVAIGALADRAERARLAGDAAAVDAACAQGAELLADARARAAHGRPRLAVLGPEGRAWLARAEAEEGRLRGVPDPACWQRVVDAFGFGHRYEQARSRWRRAEALAASGDRSAATLEAVAAWAEADRLGARPLRDAVDALGRRAGLDLGGGPAAADAVLTRREQEVIRLVAAGLTNRQIGQQLFISEKTASVHISNVLAKLGASGRAEAVDLAHRRGLLAD